MEVDSPIGPLNPQECVPFNPFGLGNANQAAKDWIVDPEKKQFRVLNQDFAELLATGIVSEGWGAGALSLAAGLTWRDEEFTQDNYPALRRARRAERRARSAFATSRLGFASAGNRSLHPFSAIGAGNGERSVWEWFGELNMPLWQFDSGQRVGSTFAYRSSDYELLRPPGQLEDRVRRGPHDHVAVARYEVAGHPRAEFRRGLPDRHGRRLGDRSVPTPTTRKRTTR